MPAYIAVAWLVPSLLGPVVLALILLVVLRSIRRHEAVAYAVGMLSLLAAISASVSYNLYVATLYRNWWSHGPMWWFDVIAAILTFILALLATVMALPELFAAMLDN